MALNPVSHQFLRDVEAATGFPVHVEADDRLQAPMLARVQMARGGVPIHRVSYHPDAGAMADYLIVHQCSFVLRLYAVPPPERGDLAASDAARAESLAWVKTHLESAALPPDRQAAFAEFLRNGLLTMLRSIPVGMRIDRDLRLRFPELIQAQEQAIRRQLDDHAAILRPNVQKDIPVAALEANLAVNAAFAKFWAGELGQPGFTLPYLAAGALTRGEVLDRCWREIPAEPAHDRDLIQAWADELGLGTWIQWLPHPTAH